MIQKYLSRAQSDNTGVELQEKHDFPENLREQDCQAEERLPLQKLHLFTLTSLPFTCS